MKLVLLAILAVGVLMGIAVGLAHTDNQVTISPPLTPINVPYGDRGEQPN
jgi:hypothetical protein